MATKTKKRKPAKPLIDIEILDGNFQYKIDYDYDTVMNCSEEGCDEEGICRCGRIECFRIKSVDVPSIVHDIVSSKCSGFLAYCVDRLINVHHLERPDYWQENIQGSYYGEEVVSIKLNPITIKSIKKDIETLLKLKSEKDYICHILEKEYGYVLASLAPIKYYQLINVNPRQIVMGSEHHYLKLDPKIVESYKDYPYARGICIATYGETYRLIDGYHRMAAAKNKRIVQIIVGYENEPRH